MADRSPERTAPPEAPTPNGLVSSRPLAMFQPAFWRCYLVTARPYLMPVSGLAALAGSALAEAVSPGRLAVALAVFACSYGLGQALTDCFQQDTDRLSAPYRPLVQGTISTGQVLLASLTGLLASVTVLAALNPWNLAVSTCAVVGLVIYTPLKRRWWAGPVANAWVVALLPIMGWLTGPGTNLLELPGRPLVLLVALVSLAAYANFVLVGYLKDISADRQAGYETMPVRFGWRRTACVSHVWAAVGAALGAWAVGAIGGPWPGAAGAWLVLAAATILSAYTQFSLHRIDRQEQAYLPITNVVRVFLLLHVAIVLAARPAWWLLAAAMLVAFELLMRTRPDRRQV